MVDDAFLVSSDAGIYDRIIVQDLIKEVAQTKQLDLHASRCFKGTPRRGEGGGWKRKE